MRKITLWLSTMGLILGLLPSCDAEQQEPTSRRVVRTQNTTNGDTDSGGNDNNTGGDDTNTGGDPSFDGKAFFTATIDPLFEAKCGSCHAPPRDAPADPGPLTIFNYDEMLKKLKDGTAPDKNALLDKMRNKVAHSGGDRCQGNNNVSPCTEVMEWYKGEFGEGDGAGAGSGAGEVSSVSLTGRAVGWAINEDDPTAFVKVKLYVDGAKGAGTAQPEVLANMTGFDNGNGQKHAFATDLPLSFADGKAHKLYAYALVGTTEVELKGSPLTFYAYQKQADGQTFFNNTVKSKLESSCNGCHVNGYDDRWASLASPAPDQGGTRSNNQMVRKGAGLDNHGGGNKCGGVNSGVCADMQSWWDLEFGP